MLGLKKFNKEKVQEPVDKDILKQFQEYLKINLKEEIDFAHDSTSIYLNPIY
jgi:hypothetical protein